jgi:hypothetical protein
MTAVTYQIALKSFQDRVGDANGIVFYNKCRKALGLSETVETGNYWELENHDSERHLFGCHYSADSAKDILTANIPPLDKAVLMGMRGTIVRVPPGDAEPYVVTRGFGYTPTCVTDGNFEDQAVFTDYDGDTHSVDFLRTDTYTTSVSEGCVLRVSKFEGEVLVTTNRRINIERSRWGNSPTFLQMYRDFGGPPFETLFEGDEKTSNTTYVFMVVHPDLSIAGRFDVGSGYLIFLNKFQNNLSDVPLVDLPKSLSSKLRLTEDFPATTKCVECLPASTGQCESCTLGKTVYCHIPLNPHDMRNWLVYGASESEPQEDPRLNRGEAVIVSFVDQATYERRTIRLCSLAYNWRTAVNNNNPNHWNQFIRYYSMVLPRVPPPTHPEGTDLNVVFSGQQDELYTYNQLFPRLPVSAVGRLEKLSVDEIPSYDLDHVVAEEVLKPDEGFSSFPVESNPRQAAFDNIAACMALAVPHSKIKRATKYMSEFVTLRSKVMMYLGRNFKDFKGVRGGRFYAPGYVDNGTLKDFKPFANPDGTYNLGGETLVRLFNAAALGAERAIASGTDQRPPFAIASANLSGFIYKERGPTLYALLNSVNKFIEMKPLPPPASSPPRRLHYVGPISR